MNILKAKENIERLDQLIRLKATGSPKELAVLMNCSERNMYRMINQLKELGAPIAYDQHIQSYYYEKDCTLYFDFVLNKTN